MEQKYQPFLNDIKRTYIQHDQPEKISIDDYISGELLTADQIVNTLPANYEPTQLTGELICSICGKRMYELRESICGCIVCQECQEKQGNICLVHQVPYKFKQPTEEDYQYYSNLTFQCPYYVCGCDEVLTLKNFMSHMRVCPYAVIKCPYCHIPSPRKKFEKHYKDCQMLPCKCKFCGQPLYLSQVYNHVEQNHPVCDYCKTRIVNQEDHEKIVCPIHGCGLQMAKCILYKHLADPQNGNIHFLQFNKLIQISQKQILVDQAQLESKTKLYNKRRQIIETSQQVKVELKYMRLQTQRLILISQKSQLRLDEFSPYMTWEEKDLLVQQLLQKIVDYCISYDSTLPNAQQYYFLPHNINFIFNNNDSNFQLVINRSNKQQYIDSQNANIEQFPQQSYFKNVLHNLTELIEKYLIVEETDDIGQIQRYHNQCYSQYCKLILYLSTLLQKTQMIQIQRQIIESCLTLFKIAFSSKNDLKIYQYFQNSSSYSIYKIFEDKYIDYSITFEKIMELMQLFELPVIKYVNYEQQMTYLQHSTAKQVLDKIPRTLLQQYDFIFYADDNDLNLSEEQTFLQKLLVRSCYYPQDSYASRVLIYGGTNTGKFKHLIPQNAAKICLILNNDQTQLNLEDLIPFNDQVQEIVIQQLQYNQQKEITNQYCLQPILKSKSLQVLTIQNIRFSGVDFDLTQLENLIELNIIDCEICYLSQIKLNNKELRRLQILLHGSENRTRLYDADCIALAQQINLCTSIQELSISFNNSFSACPSFIKWLLKQNNQNLRKYDILKLEKINLDEVTCQEFVQVLQKSNIQIIKLSLSGNQDIKNFMQEIEQILNESDCEEFYVEEMKDQRLIYNKLCDFNYDELRIEKIYCEIDKLIDSKLVSENQRKTDQQKFNIEFY